MPPSIDSPNGLLSITSRVANGWVGNALIELAVGSLSPRTPFFSIDTVQWTGPGNHPRRTGPVLPHEDLANMLGALLAPGEDSFPIRHVLTGYLRTREQVHAVSNALGEARDCLGTIIVDPVLGDNGRLYISPDTATSIREELLPHADYILPNLTEAAWLANREGESDAEILAATLLDDFPNLRGVAVTSTPGDQLPDQVGARIVTRGDSHWTGGACIPGLHHGTGDFFSGTVLALHAGRGYGFTTACDHGTLLVQAAVSLHEQNRALTPRQMYRQAMEAFEDGD